MNPKYSGSESEKLWAKVREIDNIHVRKGVYVLGCAMQDIEVRFLDALAEGLATNKK